MSQPLYVAFVWHMHQPYYKDPLTNEASMPWVRLHGVKDYLDMCEMLDDYPRIHQTFNVVPSLLDQIKEYEENPSHDKFLQLSFKDASSLSKEEKAFILWNFFMANWDNMVKQFPRYYDLLIKRGKHISPAEIEAALKRFSIEEVRDLQALFNLSWIDPSFREKVPELKALSRKGSHFTEDDKRVILEIQLSILKRIVPKYRELQKTGQIEVSISPYYHPILPLLCDNHVANIALPKVPLPKEHFSHPEDARWHIDEAVRLYEDIFDMRPRGMWPSEGSVSEDMLKCVIEAGVKWVATDEEILFRSTGVPRSANALYKPYRLSRGGKEISIVFRDHGLSDLIGFTYSKMNYKDACNDFIKHLKNIQSSLSGSDDAHLVSVILDGENAWEYYPNDGRDFLSALYEALSVDKSIKCVSVSEFLNEHAPHDEVQTLYPGSWINGNFAIWIGHKEKNLAWDYLSKARNALTDFLEKRPDEPSSQNVAKAWQEMRIAEGSDWNWWYGGDHSSSCDEEFDRLYRKHLMNVYTLLGLEVPEYLKSPIRSRQAHPKREPSGFMTPVIDGRDTNYYEWISAGYFEIGKLGGTMHQSQAFIEKLYYGFDLENLYLRADLSAEAKAPQALDRLRMIVDIPTHNVKIEVYIKKGRAVAFKKVGDEWNELKDVVEAAFDAVLELGLNFKSLLKATGDEEVNIKVTLEEEKLAVEAVPQEGAIRFRVPGEDFELRFWYI